MVEPFDVYGTLIMLLCRCIEEQKSYRCGGIAVKAYKVTKNMVYFSVYREAKLVCEFSVDYRSEVAGFRILDREWGEWITEIVILACDLEEGEFEDEKKQFR